MHSLGKDRRFLFLQGPHGPFFGGLAKSLRATGAKVFRVGFNRADQAFWRGPGYIPYRGLSKDWPAHLESLITKHAITDIVLYGASRPIHTTALELGVTTHVFEEGYLRPYWITYERGGANASSRLMDLSLDEMETALAQNLPKLTEAPDRWGDMNQHMFWGAAYHAVLMAGNRGYPGFQPHRTPGVNREFLLHFAKLISTPIRAALRAVASARIRRGGFPYHLVLLQLAHDANFRNFGPFEDQASFLDEVMHGFSKGAPSHHHLVLKAHPLEDGREPLRPLIKTLAEKYTLTNRVHFVSGGKLARLLDSARSAVTVNSTSAEQALWRGLPLKVFGQAVFNRPEFVSHQPIGAFFKAPKVPDRDAYLTYRAFLLATSQIPGGFYAYRNRRKIVRQLPDLMLASQDPYAQILCPQTRNAAGRQHLRTVL
ncbi:MAG: capsule biosynthesis protein CapA [Silicimonas sp.]|nr:capsule biosynthesis protein CapA [Silicimonas sp.]